MHSMMTAALAAGALLAASAAEAADYEVKMLNVGPDEKTMVFEPPLLHVQPGDTVTFVPTDRGHNAASVERMIPAGAAGWEGAISEPVTVTFQVDGTYGYICEPHYGLGMVGLVLVGDYRKNFAEADAVRQRGRAAQRFRELFAQAAAMPAEHAVGAVPALPPDAAAAPESSSATGPAGAPAEPDAMEPAGAAAEAQQ
jgi:pseudoazurin